MPVDQVAFMRIKTKIDYERQETEIILIVIIHKLLLSNVSYSNHSTIVTNSIKN